MGILRDIAAYCSGVPPLGDSKHVCFGGLKCNLNIQHYIVISCNDTSTPPPDQCALQVFCILCNYVCIINPLIARTFMCALTLTQQPHPRANPTGFAGGNGGIVGHKVAWKGRKLVEHQQSTWPLLPGCLVLMGWWAEGLKMKGSGWLGHEHARANTPPWSTILLAAANFSFNKKEQYKLNIDHGSLGTSSRIISWSLDPLATRTQLSILTFLARTDHCAAKNHVQLHLGLLSFRHQPQRLGVFGIMKPQRLAWLCLKTAYTSNFMVVHHHVPISVPNQGFHLRWEYRPLSDTPTWQLPCPMQCQSAAQVADCHCSPFSHALAAAL